MPKRSRSYQAAVPETAELLKRRAKYYGANYKSIIKHRPQVAIDHYHLLYHLDLLDQLLTEGFDPPRPKMLQITAIEVSLIFFGAYHCEPVTSLRIAEVILELNSLTLPSVLANLLSMAFLNRSG
jgi:hypothetical protein